MENTKNSKNTRCGMKEINELQRNYNLSDMDKRQLQMMWLKNPNISYIELEKYAKANNNSRKKTYQTIAQMKEYRANSSKRNALKREQEEFAGITRNNDDDYDR